MFPVVTRSTHESLSPGYKVTMFPEKRSEFWSSPGRVGLLNLVLNTIFRLKELFHNKGGVQKNYSSSPGENLSQQAGLLHPKTPGDICQKGCVAGTKIRPLLDSLKSLYHPKFSPCKTNLCKCRCLTLQKKLFMHFSHQMAKSKATPRCSVFLRGQSFSIFFIFLL